MHIHREPIRPTSWQLQEHGRAFPPNYLHESWRDYLYWDVELRAVDPPAASSFLSLRRRFGEHARELITR